MPLQRSFEIRIKGSTVSNPIPPQTGTGPGGSEGQVWGKLSDKSYDSGWITPPGGGSSLVNLAAGETISALQVTCSRGNEAYVVTSLSVEADISSIVGIATNTATEGDVVAIQNTGVLSDSSWSWVQGDIYISPTGSLTQTPPSSGVLLRIGGALSPTKILIDIQMPLYL